MKAIDLNKFCHQLHEGKLDEQISELEKNAQEQLEYIHPLKAKTTLEQHYWGDFNQKAVELIKQLKAHIESGEAGLDSILEA